ASSAICPEMASRSPYATACDQLPPVAGRPSTGSGPALLTDPLQLPGLRLVEPGSGRDVLLGIFLRLLAHLVLVDREDRLVLHDHLAVADHGVARPAGAVIDEVVDQVLADGRNPLVRGEVVEADVRLLADLQRADVVLP